MKRCHLFFVTLFGLAVLFAASAEAAAVPQTINYQGRLTDAAGDPVPNVPILVKFIIYDDPGAGTALWNSGFQSVTPEDGLFTYPLGSMVDLPDNLFTDTIRYLGITIGADPELSPRERFRTVPYAYHALRADTAGIAATVFNGAITGTKLASNSVNSGHIINGTVTGGDLANNSVKSVHITDGTIQSVDISDGTVAAVDLAANSVGNSEMQNNAIGSAEIIDNSIIAPDLAPNSVNNGKILDGTIILADMANNSVSTLEIVDGSVTQSEIATNGVAAAEIAAGAVGASELATGSVVGGTGGDVLDNTISSADILNSTITGTDISNGSIFDNDLGDEPGVAQATSTGTTSLSGTNVTLISRTLTAPTSGWVLVIATFQANVSHSNGTFDRSIYGVSNTTSLQSNATELGISNLASSGTRKRVLTVSRMFSVGSGSTTYRLIGSRLQGTNPQIDNKNLAIAFFPTQYGSFSSSPPLPPDDNTKQQAQMETLEDLQSKSLDK